MKLRHISIKRYKNLRDFDCVFSNSNIAAFIGNNGSGKSNLLEAIATVFSYAQNISDRKNPFLIVTPDIENCRIEYELNGIDYALSCTKTELSISREGKELPKTKFTEALPKSVMLYYAGETDRQKKTAERTFDNAYSSKLKRNVFPGFKFMDSFSTKDLGLLLFCAAVYKGEYYRNLLELLNCKDILLESTVFLKRPSYIKKGKYSSDTYWGATGFVKSFLDEIKAFIHFTMDDPEYYLMSFSDISPIKNHSRNEAELFAKLKALKNAEFLDRISVALVNKVGESFDYECLSEGEKQLALLLLLTAFTSQEDHLYLFDEFDAYLHLNWQRMFSQMLRETNIQGHILFTTHSSATISNLRSDELFIMKDGTAEIPGSETYNRALDEIMMEQMGVTMRAPEIEALYDKFKQFIADKDKEGALQVVQELEGKLDASDPLFDRIRLNLRRI